MTLVQSNSDSTFANFFSLEKAKPLEAKCHVAPPWNGGTKVCSNGPSRMTNMAAMPVCGKNLKNILLNQKADEKMLKQWIFLKVFLSYDIKVGRCSQLNEYMSTLWVPKVKVIQWLRSLRCNTF